MPIPFPNKHIAESIQQRIRDVQDEIDERLAIQESFDASEAMELDGGFGGRKDRARHMYWMQKLTEKYGPNAARVIGSLHEVEGLVGNVIDAVTGERPLKEGLRETSADILTNDVAIRNVPQDEQGNYLPPNIADIKATAEALQEDSEGRIGPVSDFVRAPRELTPEERADELVDEAQKLFQSDIKPIGTTSPDHPVTKPIPRHTLRPRAEGMSPYVRKDI